MKNVLAILVFFCVVLGIGYFLYTGVRSTEHLEIVSLDIAPQPASIGWVTITIETNKPAKPFTVFVGNRKAELNSISNNVQVFRYFVSPYEKDGVKQMVISGALYNDSYGLFVNKTETIVYINNIAFYSDGGRFVVKDRVYLFSELDIGKTKRNKQIIQGFVPFISKLAGVYNISFYAVEVSEKWVQCYDSNNTLIDVKECENIAKTNPSIILKLPVYPSSQVFVGNNTIEVQPTMDEIEQTLDAVYLFIPKPANASIPEQ